MSLVKHTLAILALLGLVASASAETIGPPVAKKPRRHHPLSSATKRSRWSRRKGTRPRSCGMTSRTS